MACGILVPWPDQRFNPYPLRWKLRFLITGPPENYFVIIFKMFSFFLFLKLNRKQQEYMDILTLS